MPTNLRRFAARRPFIFGFTALLLAFSIFAYQRYFATTVKATSSTILISEFRTRGPAGAADEFVELYNATAAPIDIGGWKINRSNGSGTINTQITITAGTMIPGHGHFLATNNAAGGYSGSVPANQSYNVGITDDGGIAILNVANVIIDQVGMSAGSAYKEGTVLSQLTTNVDRSHERKPGGANGSSTDTDNNAADFQLVTPSDPQNLSSAPTPSGNQAIVPSCPTPLNTTQGTATSTSVSATDPDGTVVSATITSAAVPGITLDGFTPAAGVGGTATATLNVSDATAQGSYNVVIQYSNNDSPTPQTASCTVVVNVAPPATPTPTPTPTPISVAAGSVVISQVYGGGGNSGATFKNDFIEILNHTGSPINLSGWSVQYASATTAAWQVTPLTGVLLQAGQYYLIQEAAGAAGTVDLPTPDATGNIAMGATSGKVAVVSSAVALIGTCPVGGGIIDFVGYDGANCFEGPGAAPTLTNTTAALRGSNGCADTDNNFADFTAGAPNPRNTSTPTNNCAVLSGVGSANPPSVQPGDSSTLTVSVTPGSDPDSTGITVVADLSLIGGSATQFFAGNGNTFTFLATVGGAISPGLKSLPVTIADDQSRSAGATINLTVLQPAPPADHVVISQVYGGGGNAGATYLNDFVELYNAGTSAFDLSGWSIQYASFDGSGWGSNKQPLGGVISPGEYYLVKLASGGATGASLPAANVDGEINMSATTGKVALVSSFQALSGVCPLANPNLVDFVGYGSTAATPNFCYEGTANAPAGSNTTSVLRKNGGATDTNNNGNDFLAGAPNPRRTAPIVELGPNVLSTDPISGGFNAPHDASMTINFTEPVDVVGAWYDISCVSSGTHNVGTVAFSTNQKTYVITPNVNFQFGEQCTVTIIKDAVHDTDTDDAGPNSDTLPADYVWSFSVVSAGSPAPYPPSVHLTMGNPSDATAFAGNPNNYLMEKPCYSTSYNRDKGTPNWVSWHLEPAWFGSLVRFDTFRPDPAVLPEWYRVQATDYSGSGFDRGHMTPNADRDNENRIAINQETYLMSNMVPQAPDNNQGPWANMENDLRSLLNTGGGQELYIVSGPLGIGGSGSAGGITNTIANGHVTVPAFTWKVVLVLPKGDNDLSRVTASTRTIAIMMPNTQGIRNVDWHTYLTTVDAVEQATGYDFFANVPDAIENAIEAGIDGVNPPGTANQSASTAEDVPVGITLNAVSPLASPTFTYTIVGQPANGTLSGAGPTFTYTPAQDFNGSDSFTFRVNDGVRTSNTSTVNITVTPENDAPVLSSVPASATINELTEYSFTAHASDVDLPAQTLTFSLIGAPAGATIGASSGVFSWTPTEEQGGTGLPYSFTVSVSDGVTQTAANVSLTVNEVNQAPALNAIGSKTVYLGNTLSFTATGSDGDVPAQTLSFSLTGAVPAGASIHPVTGAFSWTPGIAQVGHIYTVTVRITDNGSPSLYAEEQVQIGVAYPWTGLLSPIQANGVYKAGKTIPLKFQLTGAAAGITTAEIRLLIFRVSDNVIGEEIEVESTSAATTGNLFRYTGDQYIFNLSTTGLATGTYQLQVDMGDGVLRAVNIALR